MSCPDPSWRLIRPGVWATPDGSDAAVAAMDFGIEGGAYLRWVEADKARVLPIPQPPQPKPRKAPQGPDLFDDIPEESPA